MKPNSLLPVDIININIRSFEATESDKSFVDDFDVERGIVSTRVDHEKIPVDNIPVQAYFHPHICGNYKVHGHNSLLQIQSNVYFSL